MQGMECALSACLLWAIYGAEFMSNVGRHAFLSNFFVGFHYLRRNAHLMGALFGKLKIYFAHTHTYLCSKL